MAPSRKKPGVTFWATLVVVVVLVGYPLSIGPATWLASRNYLNAWLYQTYCRPMLGFLAFVSRIGPEPLPRRIASATDWYIHLWIREPDPSSP